MGTACTRDPRRNEANVNDIDTRDRVRGGRLRMPTQPRRGEWLPADPAWRVGRGGSVRRSALRLRFQPRPGLVGGPRLAGGAAGVATVLGGLFLLLSRNRATAMLGRLADASLRRVVRRRPGVRRSAGARRRGHARRVERHPARLARAVVLLWPRRVDRVPRRVRPGPLSVRTVRDVEYARRPVATVERRPRCCARCAEAHERDWSTAMRQRGVAPTSVASGSRHVIGAPILDRQRPRISPCRPSRA